MWTETVFLHATYDSSNLSWSSCHVDGDEYFVREGLSRLPLKMDAPEKVLCQAHGQARPTADFLHENGESFTYNTLLQLDPIVPAFQLLLILVQFKISWVRRQSVMLGLWLHI